MSKITPKRRCENDVMKSQPSKYFADQPTVEDFHLQPSCSYSAAYEALASIDFVSFNNNYFLTKNMTTKKFTNKLFIGNRRQHPFKANLFESHR